MHYFDIVFFMHIITDAMPMATMGLHFKACQSNAFMFLQKIYDLR